jgi:hypothetical protein
MRASGQESTSSGRCINLPIFWTCKESEADRSLMDVWTGCWDVRTNASWNRSFLIQWRVRTERYVIRTDDAGLSSVRTVWHVVQTNGAVDRWASGRDNTSTGLLTGNLKSSIFFAVQSLLKMLWHVESLFTTSLHISDFVQNTEWGQNTNKLPLWPFWDKNHLTGLEIHSRSKSTITPPFLSQRDKG